jgi:enterochelin esterase-like enzyme
VRGAGFAAGLLLVAACASFPTRLTYLSHRSAAHNGTRVDYAVYTPPGFRGGEGLPLVVFLHGGFDSEDAFDRHGIAARLDAAIEARRLPPLVAVLPDGELGLWANWHDGSRRYEDWVVDELMPRVRRSHGVGACPAHCLVMGVSMGGQGALRFALHRPGRFRGVASISGPAMSAEGMRELYDDRLLRIVLPLHAIFGPPTEASLARDDLYARWRGPEDVGVERVFVAWGTEDRRRVVEGGRALSQHLAAHQIPHRAVEFEGQHRWTSWAPVVDDALAYLLAP